MKSMIKNILGGKPLTNYLPCGATEAQAFADAVMDGETKVYEQMSLVGTDTATQGRVVNVQVRDNTTGKARFMSFVIQMSKNEGDVLTALAGKTFDGIKADKVVIVSMRTQQF